ncbi:MAG: ABC transporter permease [Deltaproteobacteria bacterium]|nr:ABC transporter permease [Deltaproteobacteria bacterium]
MTTLLRAPKATSFFLVLGREVLVLTALVGGVTQLAWRTVRTLFRYRWDWKEILRQCFFVGNRSVPIVVLIAAFTGMVLALQFTVGLARFGLKLYTGQIVGLAIARELGPVLTSLMIAARVASGIAAELGSMMVTEQVLAIEAMGANPVHKLVAPRLIATMVMTPILAIAADVIGILGGMVIAMMEAKVTAHFYLKQIVETVSVEDFLHGIGKTVVFAFCIAMIACYQGLRTHGGTEGVGRSTTRAVVYASIVIFISDFFLTKLFIIL